MDIQIILLMIARCRGVRRLRLPIGRCRAAHTPDTMRGWDLRGPCREDDDNGKAQRRLRGQIYSVYNIEDRFGKVEEINIYNYCNIKIRTWDPQVKTEQANHKNWTREDE